MARTSISFRIDEDLKSDLEEICEDMGMSLSTVFIIFAEKLARERKMPFEIDSDPFYSKKKYEKIKKFYKTNGKIITLNMQR